MRVFLVVAGLFMAGLAMFILVGDRQSDVPVAERAKRECLKIHPYSEIEATNCQIALLRRYVNDSRNAQMERAYERIR